MSASVALCSEFVWGPNWDYSQERQHILLTGFSGTFYLVAREANCVFVDSEATQSDTIYPGFVEFVFFFLRRKKASAVIPLQMLTPCFCLARRNPSIWSWVWLKAIIMASMCPPRRLKPPAHPWGGERENKASFITLPSLLLQSLAPLEHYPFPVLFWCVNERIEKLQAPKEMLSMKMQQSESSRVQTAQHSTQPDSSQTPCSTLLLSLLEQDTNI